MLETFMIEEENRFFDWLLRNSELSYYFELSFSELTTLPANKRRIITVLEKELFKYTTIRNVKFLQLYQN